MVCPLCKNENARGFEAVHGSLLVYDPVVCAFEPHDIECRAAMQCTLVEEVPERTCRSVQVLAGAFLRDRFAMNGHSSYERIGEMSLGWIALRNHDKGRDEVIHGAWKGNHYGDSAPTLAWIHVLDVRTGHTRALELADLQDLARHYATASIVYTTMQKRGSWTLETERIAWWCRDFGRTAYNAADDVAGTDALIANIYAWANEIRPFV
jgi:hypothetical protein